MSLSVLNFFRLIPFKSCSGSWKIIELDWIRYDTPTKLRSIFDFFSCSPQLLRAYYVFLGDAMFPNLSWPQTRNTEDIFHTMAKISMALVQDEQRIDSDEI